MGELEGEDQGTLGNFLCWLCLLGEGATSLSDLDQNTLRDPFFLPLLLSGMCQRDKMTLISRGASDLNGGV